MLVGLTRVGTLRQRLEKAYAVPGSAEPQVAATALQWLGSPDSRDEAAAGLSQALRRAGPVLPPESAADVHVLEVASAVEQEVLCNLLREQVPLLIALTGRSAAGGSRRLATARDLVAARYLASTSDRHLSRIEAELRRTDGVTRLDRMDVYPGREPDGTLTVTVRCVDAAAGIATARAHALLLAAFGLRARRLVRDGRRLGHLPQTRLEENRARAVAHGLRARLTRDQPPGRQGPRIQETAAVMLRTLLVDTLAIELDNLGTTAEELFPVIAALDLPASGLDTISSEDALLRGWGSGHATAMLLDPTPGGPLLAAARQTAPGRTGLLLQEWAGIIAARRGGTNTTSRPPGGTRRPHPGRNGGRR